MRDRLREIAIPTLIIAGHLDTTHPSSQSRQIHAGIPGSEFLRLEHSGHGDVVVEDIPLYHATLERFLAGLPA